MTLKSSMAIAILFGTCPTLAFAQSLEIGTNFYGNGKDTQQATLLIPVHEQDGKSVSGILSFANAETSDTHFVGKGNGSSGIAEANGSANYALVGIEGRSIVLDKKWLSAFVRATYGARVGGTTLSSAYSQQTGKLYDPMGHMNVSLGVSAEIIPGMAVSLHFAKNLGGDKGHSVFMNLDMAFGAGGAQ